MQYVKPSLLDGVIGPTMSVKTISRVSDALFSFCIGKGALGNLAEQQV